MSTVLGMLGDYGIHLPLVVGSLGPPCSRLLTTLGPADPRQLGACSGLRWRVFFFFFFALFFLGSVHTAVVTEGGKVFLAWIIVDRPSRRFMSDSSVGPPCQNFVHS